MNTTESEKEKFIKILKMEQEKLSKNSKEAKEFMIKIGISTTFRKVKFKL